MRSAILCCPTHTHRPAATARSRARSRQLSGIVGVAVGVSDPVELNIDVFISLLCCSVRTGMVPMYVLINLHRLFYVTTSCYRFSVTAGRAPHMACATSMVAGLLTRKDDFFRQSIGTGGAAIADRQSVRARRFLPQS
jgi:hypothetical protein